MKNPWRSLNRLRLLHIKADKGERIGSDAPAFSAFILAAWPAALQRLRDALLWMFPHGAGPTGPLDFTQIARNESGQFQGVTLRNACTPHLRRHDHASEQSGDLLKPAAMQKRMTSIPENTSKKLTEFHAQFYNITYLPKHEGRWRRRGAEWSSTGSRCGHRPRPAPDPAPDTAPSAGNR